MPTRSNPNRNNLAVALAIAALLSAANAADAKPEEIVAKHLDSIGTADARASITSRAAQGTLRFKILVGGSGEAVGSWGRVSDHRKSNFVMRFGNGNWRGEQFITDGEKTFFAAATATHERSDFGKFAGGQDFIVKEGLLGGVLSTGWALQNIDLHRVRLEYAGLKKIGGHDLHCLEYCSKNGHDMTVKLYFEPDTHRHVKTVYSVLMVPSGIQNGFVNSAHVQDIRYTIEENFSDFQTANGITLPHHYDLQYSEELQNGSSQVYDWDMTADRINDNIGLDAKNFEIK